MIAAVSEQRSGQQLTTTWSVASNPDDTVTVTVTVTVTAASHYLDPGLFGAGSRYYSGQSTCKVSPLASPFMFPATDFAAALNYSILDPATLTLTETNYRAYPGSAPADVVILLTYNSVMATATPQ